MSPDLLVTLAFLGSPIAINIVIGWIEANWSEFANLNVNVQQLIKVVIAIVMAFGSNLLLQNVPSNVFDALGPYWKILYATLTGVFGQAFGISAVQTWKSIRERRAFNNALLFVNIMQDAGYEVSPTLLGELFPGKATDPLHKALAAAPRRTDQRVSYAPGLATNLTQGTVIPGAKG